MPDAELVAFKAEERSVRPEIWVLGAPDLAERRGVATCALVARGSELGDSGPLGRLLLHLLTIIYNWDLTHL